MKKFIFKLFQFLIVSIFCYLAIGYSMEVIIGRNTENKQFQLQSDWHIKREEYVDMLFVGNSRTYQMLDMKEIQHQTRMKSYALCQASRGSKILFYKTLTYLKFNKKPRIIFLQCDPYFLGGSLTLGTFNGKFSYLTYLFGDNLGINHLFRGEDGYKEYEAYLPLLRYFSSGPKGPYLLFAHLFNLNPYKSHLFEFGNEIESKTWLKSANWYMPPETDDLMTFEYLNMFSDLCKSNNIKLVLVYPPQSYTSFKKVNNNVLKKIKSFKKSHELPFWNFNSIEYNDSTLFYNHMHLNHIGTKKYTLQLIDSIKNYIHIKS